MYPCNELAISEDHEFHSEFGIPILNKKISSQVITKFDFVKISF